MQTHRRKKQNQSEQEFSAAKRRVLFIITISLPFIGFILLEIALRTAQYGPNLALFTTEEVTGRDYHIMNPDVKERYFSRFQFNPNSSPDYFLVPKPEGTFRIFFLGGSTTVGYPYWYVGSFSTFLRDRLQKIFPERRIEVINLGLTATNSFTTLDMAKEIVEYEPDLLIVYDGHNEFYGALGAASNESLGQARWVVLIYLQMIHFRTFLLLRDVFQSVRQMFESPTEPELTGTMMERLARGQYVPYGHSTYRAAIQNFEENLGDLVSLCVSRSIPLLLASQVSNLRHHPPFVSGDDRLYTQEQREKFDALFREALTHYRSGMFDSALFYFERCMLLAPSHADVHYHAARCLDTLGRKREALAGYILARDHDQLRFRTSSEFNDVIRKQDGMNVFFVDMEQALARASPDSIIGGNLILEHLHPTAYGYFLMAKEFAKVMRKGNLMADSGSWALRDTVGDEVLWSERSMTEFDELCAERRTEYLTAGWPFHEQPKPIRTANMEDPVERLVEDVVRGKLVWEQGHVALAEYYDARGDYGKAEKEYRVIINQLPLNVSPYLRLAHLYLRGRKYDEAQSVLLQSLTIEKTVYALKVLGSLAAEAGMLREAIGYFEDAYATSETAEDRSETGYLLAVAYGREGMGDRAVEVLREILSINPGFQPARDLLTRIQPYYR